jgi:hypothetical protein
MVWTANLCHFNIRMLATLVSDAYGRACFGNEIKRSTLIVAGCVGDWVLQKFLLSSTALMPPLA